YAELPQFLRAPVRGHRPEDARAVGQLPADLQHGRDHQGRGAAQPLLGGRAVTRVVVVSNRVADADSGKAPGGLAVGVLAALEQTGGMWFGWSGKLGSGIYSEPEVVQKDRITYATFPLNRAKFDEYYNGFCNNILWPVFHYTLGLLEYDRSQHHAYLQINSQFARWLVPLLTADDVIWVHDYHLIPLAKELRRLGV